MTLQTIDAQGKALDPWGYGDADVSQQIYNGDDAELNEYPFMVCVTLKVAIL